MPNYFDPFAPRSKGRYYPWMPFGSFIYPTGTVPEKDHWLGERARDILPARDYFNGEVFNVGPNLRPDLPSLQLPPAHNLGQDRWRNEIMKKAGVLLGAAALVYLLLKK